MHITAGIWKGKRIFPPKNRLNIRPTTEANRQAIFNIIQHKYQNIENATVLDLFAGSGIIGLEALSRGAKNAVFIDYSTEAIRLIKKNIYECVKNYQYTQKPIPKCVTIRKNLLNRWKYPSNLQKADIVIIDPPYQDDIAEIAIQNCINSNAIQQNALFIVEQSSKYELKIFQNMTLIEKRDKSNSAIWFLKKKLNI